MCISPRWLVPIEDHSGKDLPWTYKMIPLDQTPSYAAMVDTETGEALVPFQVGCGRCLECIALKREQWTARIQDEAKLYDHNCFVTLTYDPDYCDDDLHPDHFAGWLKRLRRRIEPARIRYFGCGEYGTQGKRPHYHCIIFGYDFPDRQPWSKSRRGNKQFRSPLLEETWTFGYSSVVDLGTHVCGYACKDFQKLLPLAEGRTQPFCRMSLKPGIGADGWNRKLTDGKLWHDGQSVFLPRYYKKIAEREGLDMRHIQELSILRAQVRHAPDPEQYEERFRRLTKKIAGILDN